MFTTGSRFVQDSSVEGEGKEWFGDLSGVENSECGLLRTLKEVCSEFETLIDKGLPY